jgi:hypothetical protein
MFFDQMMQLYNHYTVLSATLRATVNATSNTGGQRAAVMISGDTSASSDFRVNLENGQIAMVVLEGKEVMGSSANFYRKVDIGRFQGVKDPLDDPDLRGNVASNPTEQTYFHMLLWNPQSVSVPAVQWDFAIEYDVVFQEPRKAPLS